MVESTTSKDQLKQVFNQFDQDGNGFLDFNEIKQVSKELGKDLADHEIKKIFDTTDINGDGKISFDEFYTYWHYGMDQKLEQLVYYKLKSIQQLEKTVLKITKLGPVLENKYDNSVSDHFFSYQYGEAPPQSYINLQILQGKEHVNSLKEVHENLNLDPNCFAIILQLQVEDSSKAKTEFEELFNTILETASAFAPPEIAENILPTINISYQNPSPNSLLISITCNHGLVQMQQEAVQQILNEHLSDEFTNNINFKIQTSFSPKDLVQNSKLEIGKIIQKNLKSLAISLETKLNKQLIKKTIKSQIYDQMIKGLEKNNIPSKLKKLTKILPLFLIEGSKISLNTNYSENFDLGGSSQLTQTLQSLPTFEAILQMAKQGGADPAILDEIPIVQQFLDAFKNNVQNSVNVTIQALQFSVTLQLNIDGFGDLVDFIINQLKQ